MNNHETKTMKISDVRSQLNAIADQVYRSGDRILVEKSGIPVMAVISARDLERLQYFEAERARAFEVFDRIREEFKDVPAEEIEREADRAIAEVRKARTTKAVATGSRV